MITITEYMHMHPEILTILDSTDPATLNFKYVTFKNAEKILNYIEDINLERTGKFEVTPAESLYMLWSVDEWDFHIECLNNGMIQYTFRKNNRGKIFGLNTTDEFIPLLEHYLLMEFR